MILYIAGMGPVEVYHHLGAVTSRFALFMGVLVLVASLVFLLLRWHVARTQSEEATTLGQGEALLRGTVVFARDHRAAMRTEILQVGIERRGKHGPRTQWREVDRKSEVFPFYLKRPNGERVRIEPSQETQLIDTIRTVSDVAALNVASTQGTVKASSRMGGRRGVAELSENEDVWIRGSIVSGIDPEAEGSYRGQAAVPILRASKAQPLVVATAPLDTTARHMAFFELQFVMLASVLMLVFTAFVVAPVVDRGMGEERTGTVTSCIMTRNSKGRFAGYSTTVALEGGEFITEKLTGMMAKGSRVPVLQGHFSTQVGREPTVNWVVLFTSFILWGVCAVIYFSKRAGAVPWYAQPLVVSEERGSIAETATAVLAVPKKTG